MANPLEQRKDYLFGELLESGMFANPIEQMALWLTDATIAKILEPNGMTVSTVGANGQPSSRVVLLRGLDEQGLVFFSNHHSRKGQELAGNNKACINFWWPNLERQVRIEGTIQPVSQTESDAYFYSRPYESQLASAASPQSQIITREELEQRIARLREQFPNGGLQRPQHWGGYRLAPNYFEFWQGRAARTHDRIVYALEDAIWKMSRIAP